MQNQSNNGVKGKEAETAKEKRPDSQPRKSVLKGNTQNNSKGTTKFIENSGGQSYHFIIARRNCSMPDLRPTLLLLSSLLLQKLVDS